MTLWLKYFSTQPLAPKGIKLKDSDFKNFPHKLPKGSKIYSRGENISTIGNYRPDISIINNNESYLILESESKSDRKAFIGAIVHAFKFADEKKLNINLIIIMKETGNQTTTKQVSNNIKPYYEWLNSIANIKLDGVFIISDTEYINSSSNDEILLSENFKKRCITL